MSGRGGVSSIATLSSHDHENSHFTEKYSIEGDNKDGSILPHYIGWIHHPSPIKASKGPIPKENIAIPHPIYRL